MNAQSSGEEALIALFAELYEALQYSEKDNVIIAIDEGDSFLHPEWQRLYVNNIVTFLDFINIKRGWNKNFKYFSPLTHRL
jgi:predicted ATP-binding protein involved in virulence